MIAYIRQALQGHYTSGEASALSRLILTEIFRINPIDIYMGKDISLSPEEQSHLDAIINRLLQDEPIQYILGYADFCGLRFAVNHHVLIPRPETTELIETILQDHPTPPESVLDIGTGSGCIPITLSHHWPQSRVHAWDISTEALETAETNNRHLHTQVTFRQCDILQPIENYDTLEAPFNLIVSNPPYIKACEKQEMERNVLDWEPHLALFVPDEDPLLFYRTIIGQATSGLLSPGGWLYFEINREHGKEIIQLMHDCGFVQTKLIKDLSGNDRIIKGMWPKESV